MSLSEKEVHQIAKLAGIAIDEVEASKMVGELNDILAYVEKLQAVSTLGVEPTSHVHGSLNAFRDDIVQESLPLSKIEEMAPDFSHGHFRVPKIIS